MSKGKEMGKALGMAVASTFYAPVDEVESIAPQSNTITQTDAAGNTVVFVEADPGQVGQSVSAPSVQVIPRRKKVAIIGFTEHRMMAPFNDPEWETWMLNELYNHVPFVPERSRWFELHKRELVKATPRDPAHLEKLRNLGCPVYMHEAYPDIPNSVRYPLEAMIQMFGGYFTNSISYMLALAIAEGFEEIGVWGVNMAAQSEYGHQRPSCEYFLGIALGRGIKIHLPLEADLLKAKFLYGYQEEERNAYNAKLLEQKAIMHTKIVEYDRQIAQKQAEIQQLNEAKQQHLGAMQAVDQHLATWDIPMINLPGVKPGG